jgi:N-acyl-D-amino-acid deacylase
VTSLIMSHCGFEFAPVKPVDRDRDRAMLMMTRTEQNPYESIKAGMNLRWKTFPEWLDDLERFLQRCELNLLCARLASAAFTRGLEAAKSRSVTPAARRADEKGGSALCI